MKMLDQEVSLLGISEDGPDNRCEIAKGDDPKYRWVLL